MMNKEENTSGVGERIKEIRKRGRIQQKEMAAKLDIAPSYLCEIEKGISLIPGVHMHQNRPTIIG